MAELLLKGNPLNSSAAIREVIADMRKTLASPDMVLDMDEYGSVIGGNCVCCAGGSAVIHGLGASPHCKQWTEEEWQVAEFYNDVRLGRFKDLETQVAPIPEPVRMSYDDAMCWQSDPGFFAAWERFADALEAYEKSAGVTEENVHP